MLFFYFSEMIILTNIAFINTWLRFFSNNFNDNLFQKDLRFCTVLVFFIF